MKNADTVILGGGLAGLTTAYLLNKRGRKPIILEARRRLGGRIHTTHKKGEPPMEMGATWLGKKHHHLVKLLEELNIGIFEQHMGTQAFFEPISTSPPQLVQLPENEEPSYRIQGGNDSVIQALAQTLSENQILFNQKVKSIHLQNGNVIIEASQDRFESRYVISTLAPHLLAETIRFSPELPGGLMEIARKTHTWMADSIKVGLVYEQPFWRSENASGTIMSNVGPLTELYDHSSSDDSHFALTGFMNGAYHQISQKERKSMVISQLSKFYGSRAKNFTRYTDLTWRDEPLTFQPYEEEVIPHQHNGHSVFQKSYWDGQLYLAGSETASAFPGYMDGAIESARRVTEQIAE